jgi:hypothetical protein
MARGLWWLPLIALTGCGDRSSGDPSPGVAGAGRSSVADGASGMGNDVPACDGMVNDAPPVSPECPTNENSGSVLAQNMASGGPIADGTYDLIESVVWRSDCGAFGSQQVQGTLRVHDGVIDAAWSGPDSVGTASYDFSSSGSELTLTRTCGTLSEAVSPLPYTAEAGRFLVGSFPFGTVFEPVFVAR